MVNVAQNEKMHNARPAPVFL